MSYKIIIAACIIAVLPIRLGAQERLQGLFEGTLTVGGLESARKLRIEIFLKINRQEVTGRSYVYLGKGQMVEMEVKGYLYGDFSVYLQEIRHIPPDGPEQLRPPYFRKYQLQYGGNFEEVTLTGFWQEETGQPLDRGRAIGKVRLRKVSGSKA